MRHHRLRSCRILPLLAPLFAFLAPFSAANAGDGDLDTTWGGDGISAGLSSSEPRASSVGPDQRLYLTGHMTLPDDAEVEKWRIDDNGAGQWLGCSNVFPLLDHFEILESLLDSSDRLLYAGTMTVFGTESVQRAFVARLEGFAFGADCDLDTFFSGAGWEYFDDAPYCDTEDCRLIDIEESRDATTKYIALLERVTGVVTAEYFLVGLTAAGALDANFGIDGLAYVPAPELALTGGGVDLVVDSQNRPLVLHSFYDPAASFDVDAGLTRFQSDGDLDTTFQNAGTYFISDQNTEDTYARTLAIGSDGRLGFGYFNATANHSSVQAVRNDGSGFVGTQLANLDLRAVAFDGLGRLLTATNLVGSDGMEIGRRNVVFGSVVSPDATFGVNGLRFVDIDGGGANGELPVDIVTPGGLPLILVEANQAVSGSQAYLVRLENSLIFADGFEWGSTKFW